MRTLLSGLALVLATTVARAQPVTEPEAVPPLAQIRDEKQLADALATITQDPTVRVDDDKARPLAAALMTEGVRQLQAQAYDQALANFLEAYAKFPSPKILLNIASTLRDMGRAADAANTYQRYLADPKTGPERIEEVKKILVGLDAELTLLTVKVTPQGSDVSIDGGPFITVGSALVTRVRPGIHLVRVRNGIANSELTVNGFEGEQKDVEAIAISVSQGGSATSEPTPPQPKPVGKVDDVHQAWLTVGTQYGTSDPMSNSRTTRSGFQGAVIAARMPTLDVDDDAALYAEEPAPARKIASGAIGLIRIDGKRRGLAFGLGVAFAPVDSVELELAGLRSSIWGVYAGVRVRFLTGMVRPYVGGGIPIFFFHNDATMQGHVAPGLRAAGGGELRINGHLSVQADLGIEHFFNLGGVLVDGKQPDATVFVPTIGVIGRL